MKVYIAPYTDDGTDREVSVEIHKYDTWSMDETLAHIVLPMLKQLKEDKQGSPHVDKEDTPESLWPNEAEEALYAESGVTDIHYFARWDYVLDEMIFAFQSKLEDWEEQFYSGEMDRISVPIDKDGNEVPEEEAEFYRWTKGPNDTFEVDLEGMKAYQKRISNGFLMFGKYYSSLWD